jgi:hypothetical protein
MSTDYGELSPFALTSKRELIVILATNYLAIYFSLQHEKRAFNLVPNFSDGYTKDALTPGQ